MDIFFHKLLFDPESQTVTFLNGIWTTVGMCTLQFQCGFNDFDHTCLKNNKKATTIKKGSTIMK